MKKIKIAYIIWGILVVVLMVLLTFLGFLYQKKLKPYKTLEDDLINVTEKYIELNFLYPTDKEQLKVTSNDLIKANLLNNFSHNNKECDGYVIVTYDGVYRYDSFIKCDNYVTKGY